MENLRKHVIELVGEKTFQEAKSAYTNSNAVKNPNFQNEFLGPGLPLAAHHFVQSLHKVFAGKELSPEQQEAQELGQVLYGLLILLQEYKDTNPLTAENIFKAIQVICNNPDSFNIDNDTSMVTTLGSLCLFLK